MSSDRKEVPTMSRVDPKVASLDILSKPMES